MGIKSLKWAKAVKTIGAIAGLAGSAYLLGRVDKQNGFPAAETDAAPDAAPAEGQSETTEQAEQTTANEEEVPE